MNYRALFIRIKNLIVSPSSEWTVIAEEELTGVNVVHKYALPLIAFCSLAAFLGTAIYLEGFNVEESLKKALLIFCSLFFSVYVSMGALYYAMPRFGLNQNRDLVFKFVAYSSTVIFAVKFVTELIPELFFLKILVLYTAYIVWEGVTPIFNIDEKFKPGFVTLASLILIAGNYLVLKFLHLLLPGV